MGQKGTCKLCERSDIGALDARLGAGESLAAVSRDARVPKSSLHLHWKQCRRAGKAPAASVPVPPPLDLALLGPLPIPVLPPDDPRAGTLVALANVHRIAQDAYQRAHDDKDNRAIALLVPQMRMNLVKAIEIAMKGRREERAAEERLMENPDFAAASKVLMDTLDRFPDAKAAVIEALSKYLGRV